MYIGENDCFGLVPLPIKEPHSSEAGNSRKQSTIGTQLFIEETDKSNTNSRIGQNG